MKAGQISWVPLERFCPGIEALPLSLDIMPRETFELPLIETVYLGAMLRYFHPASVFEIGTFKGRTTRLIADMTGESTRVYTLDLPPDELAKGGYFSQDQHHLVGQSIHALAFQRKITQVYGNSRTFDFSPFYGQIDFVFIDGDHSYEGVKSDTENALKMVRRGGVIVWDDCNERHTPGVVQCLRETASMRTVFRLEGTRFGCCRAET